MRPITERTLNTLYRRHPVLAPCQDSIYEAEALLCDAWASAHKLLICGNGGSAADGIHVVGELMKGFRHARPIPESDRIRIGALAGEVSDYICDHLQVALPALALVTEVGLTTAFTNDVAADLVFAQQVYGYGVAGDVLLAISTSGNSKNVVYAAQVARSFGLHVIALTGASGGVLADIATVAIKVPEQEVYKIQELHLPVYHALCLAAEEEFFGSEDS
jgi:D-sedoheptulose 7-phosphate isomerase